MSGTEPDRRRFWDKENPQHDPNKRDWSLYTDGSACGSGYGGAAALVLDNRTPAAYKLVLARNHTSVAEMEFQALLMGLEKIESLLGNVGHRLRYGEERKPTVFWLSDRLDLIRSAVGLNGKKSFPGLWHQYARYGQILDIHPYYAPRESTMRNSQVDQLAGNCRQLVKELEEVTY